MKTLYYIDEKCLNTEEEVDIYLAKKYNKCIEDFISSKGDLTFFVKQEEVLKNILDENIFEIWLDSLPENYIFKDNEYRLLIIKRFDKIFKFRIKISMTYEEFLNFLMEKLKLLIKESKEYHLKFQAKDGKIFDDMCDCLSYERNLKKNQRNL